MRAGTTDKTEQDGNETLLRNLHALMEAMADSGDEFFDAEEELEPTLDQLESTSVLPKGLQGADTLQLRATEHAHEVGIRGPGTPQQRTDALFSAFPILDELTRRGSCKVDVDDSWEDMTGMIRCRAKDFKNPHGKHDTSSGSPGDSPHRPPLPLLYDPQGEPEPLPPPTSASQDEIKKYYEVYFMRCRGKVRIADMLALTALEKPKWSAEKKPYPPFVAAFSEGLLADRSNSAFELAPNAVNTVKRAHEIIDRLVRGGYKFLRATNGFNFGSPPPTRAHITWSEILGQHCSSYFDPVVQLRNASPTTRAEQTSSDPDEASSSDKPDPTPGAFEFSFLKELDRQHDFHDELEYRCQLIRTRFAQFEEYLDRSANHRQCTMCHGPGAACVLLPIGDEDVVGLEWEDPVCFCMVCRGCAVHDMLHRDLGEEVGHQRCRACWVSYGGYQIHNAATKKLMLMQAATQVMLFFGPRQEDEPEETFEENVVRRACIKTLVEVGFMRALSIDIAQNKSTCLWLRDKEGHLQSGGWMAWGAQHNDKESTGYSSSAIEGRLLLRLAEAEAQLENYEAALAYAKRSAELLGTLHRGRIVDGVLTGSHPARKLISPASQVMNRLAKLAAKPKSLTDRDVGERHDTDQKSNNKGGKGKKKKKR